jgi:alkylation response protein AidB-like acyl-CoA dehydrogenase
MADSASSRNDGNPVERAEALALLVAASSEPGEADRRVPENVMAALHAAGLFRLLLPRDFGGEEVAPATFMRVIEAIAKADASTAWCLCQNAVCAMTAAYLAPETAAAIFGDPRAILAWGPPQKASAVAVEGGYRLTGSWSFASGGRYATWLGGQCSLVEPNGTPRRDAAGAPLGRTLLFPASAAPMTDIWHVIGLRATASDAYSVTDLFVPEACSFQRDEPAERRHAGPLYLFRSNNVFGGGFAALSLGLAEAMLGEFITLARAKTPSGAAHSLARSGVVQSRLAEAEAQRRAARAYLFATFEEIWEAARSAGTLTIEQRMAIRLATTYTIRHAREIVDFVYDAAGATAIFASSPFERRFRDMHAVAQQVQGRLAHFETVGQFLLGLEPDLAWL